MSGNTLRLDMALWSLPDYVLVLSWCFRSLELQQHEAYRSLQPLPDDSADPYSEASASANVQRVFDVHLLKLLSNIFLQRRRFPSPSPCLIQFGSKSPWTGRLRLSTIFSLAHSCFSHVSYPIKTSLSPLSRFDSPLFSLRCLRIHFIAVCAFIAAAARKRAAA